MSVLASSRFAHEVRDGLLGNRGSKRGVGAAWGAKSPPDGPRYRAIGSSMAVNVVRWIGRRIEAIDRVAGAIQEAAE